MRPLYRNALLMLCLIVPAAVFVFVTSSVIGLLLIAMLIFCFQDLLERRRRSMTQSLNSAICAVSQYDGSVAKVAAAFSRRGPLRGPCYEFARRLLMGERPIEAAAMSRVPLKLSTAVALESPGSDQTRRTETSPTDRFGPPDWNTMPVYAQLLYLSVTVICTCLVLAFITALIMPMFDRMYYEIGYDQPRYWWSIGGREISPSWLLVPSVALMMMVPIWSRGHVFGIRLPRWLPAMPRVAERRAETLSGLADAVDAGWPIRRGLEVGDSISINPDQRRSLQRAMGHIDRGIEPAEALNRVGLIDAREASWLSGATAQRSAQLLRTIADQGVRDAAANLRWLMAIVFPIVVLMLGIAVLAYAVDLFSMLTGVIR